MIGRILAELMIYALVGATVAPLLGYTLAQIVVDEASRHFTIPMAVILLMIVSFVIAYAIRSVTAHFMVVNFNKIAVAFIVFFFQMIICTVLLASMLLPIIYVFAIACGSFVNLVITIIKRPITIVSDNKDQIREIHERNKDHLRDLHDEFRKRLR